jgi:hypothetical protein
MMDCMMFDESYGILPDYLLKAIRRFNVSVADWDMMLTRWGYSWGDAKLPFEDIHNHIAVHSANGSYFWPMYG